MAVGQILLVAATGKFSLGAVTYPTQACTGIGNW